MIGPWQRFSLDQPRPVSMHPMQFRINGREVFIKGANWQHPEALSGEIDPERIDHLLSAARQANMNMIRVWGGGCIESNHFYEQCARHGLMVWQDFFFACAHYPIDNAEWLAEVESEVEDIVRRLRNHGSIVCWCGDNESDMILHDKGVDPNENALTRNVIPGVLKRFDPQNRYFHISSPSGGTHPRSDWAGDRRNWGAWYPEDNYRHIREDLGRFISEGGSYAMPDLRTIDAFMPTELQWPMDHETWRLHTGDLDSCQRRFDRINEACWSHFDTPTTLEDTIEISQFAQAWGYKMLIEHCRRRRGECGGVLLWKLNDAWPAVDAGLLDYYLRPRLALHFVAEAFKPVAVSIRQPLEAAERALEVWAVNDQPVSIEGRLWVVQRVFDESRVRFEERLFGENGLRIPGESSRCCCRLVLGEVEARSSVWVAGFLAHDASYRSESLFTLLPRTAWRYWRLMATDGRAEQAEGAWAV